MIDNFPVFAFSRLADAKMLSGDHSPFIARINSAVIIIKHLAEAGSARRSVLKKIRVLVRQNLD